MLFINYKYLDIHEKKTKIAFFSQNFLLVLLPNLRSSQDQVEIKTEGDETRKKERKLVH